MARYVHGSSKGARRPPLTPKEVYELHELWSTYQTANRRANEHYDNLMAHLEEAGTLPTQDKPR
jgi:hypothetical protein